MQFLKELKWNSIINSVLMIVLGFILIFYPGLSLGILTTLIAVLAIVGGLFSIIRYFTYDLKESYYRNDFLFGIIAVTLGALILYKPAFFISVILYS